MTKTFPCPAEHAFVMVEVCESLPVALELAQMNIQGAVTEKDFRYWSNVESALMEMAACLAN